MKLGPRVALVTTLTVAGVLAAATGAMLHLRRADLEADLRRQMRDMADTLAASIEPLPPEGAREALEKRVSLTKTGAFRLEMVASQGQRPTNPWAPLVEEATLADAPAGRLFEGEAPFYAIAIPIHSDPPGEPRRHVVAFLGLVRDCSYLNDDVFVTARRLAPWLSLAVLGFGLVIYLVLMGSVVKPLRRLVDGIDAVAKGDLSRALLPQREDEIGSLAGRFNAMTNYLRQAREEEAGAKAARVEVEERLRHSEKLATVGQMAAEIAHEVGTPLNVIGGRAKSLAKRAGDPAEVRKNAEIIAAQVDRLTKIIRQVLDFSRKSRPTMTQVDLARAVDEAISFVDERLKRQRIRSEVQRQADLPLVPGNPDEIQQVVLNLVTNAIHAMPDGGRLNVVVQQVIRRKEGLALSSPAPYLMLEVSDTGAGVPHGDRERIFEAFFTTKDVGEGTGLGLAVSNGIVKDHDGWMELGDPPQGALFRVFLPVSAPADDDDPLSTSPGLPKKSESATID